VIIGVIVIALIGALTLVAAEIAKVPTDPIERYLTLAFTALIAEFGFQHAKP
jgi:hypothetical protein